MRKLFICAAALVAFALNVAAQEGAWSVSVGTEAASQYLWRGFDVATTPTLVPTVTLDYEKDDFSFETGYCSITELFGDKYLEMDVWASATFKGFTFMALEQGCGNNLGIGGYDDNFELTLAYELPFEAVPASISWNTFVAGDDFNNDGRQAYSSYIELNVPYQVNNFSVCATAGAVPYKSEQMYEVDGGFHFINLGMRAGYNFEFGEHFEMPVYAQYTFNPLANKHLYMIGCSLTYTFDL